MLQRILIVEDEPTIADTLVYALKTEGFEPVWRTTGAEALMELEGAQRPGGAFALVVLDVGLPDVNGFELCKKIRAQSAVPVLFLTARADEIDRIVGLEIGGDDYVTKPFSPREVCARVKAILRRGGVVAAKPALEEGLAASSGKRELAAAAGAVKTDEFFHDPERCEVKFRGQRLELTRYEYRLLKTLLGRRGRVYSRDELMTQAWEDPGASLDRTVDAHIKTLRAKLRAAAVASGLSAEALESDPIQTHRGMGYSLRG
ncbi:two-component system response regulator CreB [Nibricoccus aquaticus]|uniref:Two-component system response regulator CreB n=1 Tax=Nibricoccus aquaticus TaxID=2576891 RepID=A0A290QG00_9BACT|nr:two-component system response regulator CreB [Nibricoccus aquaticus]ATC64268.1 two-component system response regulator CreB [Nibricoccus aquaticus]